MVNEPYLQSADDGPIARNRSAIWLKSLKPSQWCQSLLFHIPYLHYNHYITFIQDPLLQPHYVLLNAVITGYEPRPDLRISLISWAQFEQAHVESGSLGIGINKKKRFQRSFIEPRFPDLLKGRSKRHGHWCQRKSTKHEVLAQVEIEHIKFTEEDQRQKAIKGCTSQGKRPKGSTSLGAKVNGNEHSKRQVCEQCKQLVIKTREKKSDACSVVK